MLDLACFESGDLSDLRRAALQSHWHRCARCGSSLADLRQARNEILGPTASARSIHSQRAAEEIQNILYGRVY